MQKIKNYHPTSMMHEKRYKNELLWYFSILVASLNEIKELTDEKIEAAITGWQDKYGDEIAEVNYIHLQKLDRFTNRILTSEETRPEQKELLNKLANANIEMVGLNVDYLRQQFTQLKVLENTYDYSKEMSDKFVQETASTVMDKVALFAVMSTIANLRELIFGNAESEGNTEYQWATQRDQKVRPLHAQMDKKWVRFDDPSPQPLGLHVGMDYNCRCYISAVRATPTTKADIARNKQHNELEPRTKLEKTIRSYY